MIHAFTTMGTMASLRLPGEDQARWPLGAVREVFRQADSRFSLYRPESEASAMARGETAVADASPVMLDAYADALEWRGATEGAFTPHRADGVIDLSGIVKALAMAEAGRTLRAAGCASWLLNVGGDVLCAGTDGPRGWCAGIVDPQARDALLCAVALGRHRHAIATSGIAERGEHIRRTTPGTGPSDLVQVTVMSAGIVQADVLATAILAGGRQSLDTATGRWDIDVLAATRDGELLASAGMRAMITREPGQVPRPAPLW
ncbi:FAD:protein FMN transferase [Paeniglutamicibacter cryotolerans]|uniref:FAD:protein FMN transferase n=1 Tax=Paeniglutamicibacter cryotolerans TaxID=670079 RepID=A0A839QJT1_9MICC|nr:FAD:protein FMN transferase [Paeniglutamicibacter cryotolerans]MBB2996459.1 thiamine biosynthesis lipoprotein [Paeniglutamicibacter cryotolerans]